MFNLDAIPLDTLPLLIGIAVIALAAGGAVQAVLTVLRQKSKPPTRVGTARHRRASRRLAAGTHAPPHQEPSDDHDPNAD